MMIENNFYNLVYSEVQGCFHYDDLKDYPSNSYETICNALSEDDCREFTNKIFSKYSNVNSGQMPVPKLSVIREEFKKFSSRRKLVTA